MTHLIALLSVDQKLCFTYIFLWLFCELWYEKMLYKHQGIYKYVVEIFFLLSFLNEQNKTFTLIYMKMNALKNQGGVGRNNFSFGYHA